MRKMDKPTFSTEDVFNSCISNKRGNIDKYKRALPTIVDYAKTYDEKMVSKEVYLFKPHDTVTDEVGKKEMIDLYKNKLACQGQPARAYYDRIIMSAPNGICPVCGIGTAATLDHYLAKSLYPALAVSPENLVPSCRDCNTLKGNEDFLNYEDMTLHPYYDDFEDKEWLEARIDSISPMLITYYVSDSIKEQEIRARLEHHLNVFELYEKYAMQAVEHISSSIKYIENIYRIAGKDKLQRNFALQYESSCENEKNSWRTALLRALKDFDWDVAFDK